MMKQYIVTGMSCAACSARVEKAVRAVEGVENVSVNLLTNTMGVEGDVSSSVIVQAVEAAGYGARPKEVQQDMKGNTEEDVTKIQQQEIKTLWTRLIASLGFLIVLMYISMGHMMWGFPLPAGLDENVMALGLMQLLLCTAVMVINQRFFVSGFKAVWNRAPNMDTLVSLGSAASFVYSTWSLFVMSDALLHGDSMLAMKYYHELYFESAAMILAFITLGKLLEAKSKGRTTDALKSLMKLAPRTATVLRAVKEEVTSCTESQCSEAAGMGLAEQTISIEEVVAGDIFVVRPGEAIPVDGVVLEGSSAVNEAVITGESIPVDKAEGDTVTSATMNQSGYLKCRATRVGQDTTLSRIIHMVSDAASTKAPIAKIADRVSGVFVPAVLLIAVVTFVVWLLLGETIGFALARGISVLVISCPCALGLATPVAIMVGSGVGAGKGILYKSAEALEMSGRIQTVVLDKTGTITKGEPMITKVVAAEGVSREELLSAAFLLEQKSEHPLAKAIVAGTAEYAPKSGETLEQFVALPGNGVQGVWQGMKFCGGNETYAARYAPVSERLHAEAEALADMGNTPLFFVKERRLLGIIALADVLKEDSREAVAKLRSMGLRVVMLTGDHERTARAIGNQLGGVEVIAGVKPDGKEAVIRSLREKGKVAMVGDGINDAPALTRADVGIAIGAGTDIAIDAADVVLMKSSLYDVVNAILLGRAALRTIHQNLFWAFIYNAIGIPVAAGVWIAAFGWELSPMFGAAAMSLSSFCVVTNALRLNFFKGSKMAGIGSGNPENKQAKPSGMDCAAESDMITLEEDITMKKTMKITGMMCGHCEARVKKCLEALPEVTEAAVSHETGTAIVTLSREVSDEVLRQTVEAQDYPVTEIV